MITVQLHIIMFSNFFYPLNLVDQCFMVLYYVHLLISSSSDTYHRSIANSITKYFSISSLFPVITTLREFLPPPPPPSTLHGYLVFISNPLHLVSLSYLLFHQPIVFLDVILAFSPLASIHRRFYVLRTLLFHHTYHMQTI